MKYKKKPEASSPETPPLEMGISESGGDGGTEPDANVTVSYGTHHSSFPIRGMTVQQARKKLSPLLNIDQSSVAVINGAVVENDTVINEDMTLLTFVKPASVRGSVGIQIAAGSVTVSEREKKN